MQDWFCEYARCNGEKYRRREYSGGERINWKKLLGYDAVREYCLEGLCIRAPIEELRCNWSNKKLGLPHENDLAVGRSVGWSVGRSVGRSVGWSVGAFSLVSEDGKKFADDNR